MIDTLLHHRTRTALPAWQCAVALVYVVLFAAVLPFIYLGAWAQPCHPHGRPHFVFLEPVHSLPTTTTGSGVSCAPSALATHAEHGNAHKGAAPKPLSGQALADVSLVLLLFVLMANLLNIYHIRHEASRLTGLLFSIQPILSVPTPPPRRG